MTARTIIITGASKGLGLAIARAAWAAGHSLALVARDKGPLEKAGELFQRSGPQTCSLHAVDLVDEAATRRAFLELSRVHASVFALVNNAATWTGGDRVRDLSSARLREALDLNLFSAFHATQAFLHLPEAELPYRAIVNVGATSSLRGGEQVFAFSAGKMALRGLSMSLAKESWKEGIHVAHVVVDGLLDNERTRKRHPELPDHRFLKAAAVAQTILHAVQQDPSCWTFEWDVRNQNASWPW